MLQNAAQNINIYRINGFFRCNWSNFIHLRVTLATTVCRSWMVSTENHTNKGRNWQYSVILTPLQTWRLVCTLILCVSALWLSSDPFHQLLALPSPAAKGLLHWQGAACAISYGWEPLLTGVNLCACDRQLKQKPACFRGSGSVCNCPTWSVICWGLFKSNRPSWSHSANQSRLQLFDSDNNLFHFSTIQVEYFFPLNESNTHF